MVDRLPDLTAQPDGDLGDPLHSRGDVMRHLVAQQGVDLAHVTYRILARGGFGAHRAIEADHPIDPIAAPHLTAIPAFGRRPQHGEIHAPARSGASSLLRQTSTRSNSCRSAFRKRVSSSVIAALRST